jgi:hypothetical protein
MAEEAPKKAKLGLGHWVALAGAALALILLLVQMILVFTTKPTAGAIINTLAQTALMAIFLAAAVVALLMARKNARLYAVVYGVAAGVFLLAPVSLLARTLRAHVVTFYFLICVLAFIVGALVSSGALTLPTSADVRGVTKELQHKEEQPPSEPPAA